MIRWGTLIGLFVTLGCGGLTAEVPLKNIIMVNADGLPVNPAGNPHQNMLTSYPEFETDSQYKAHIAGVVDGLKAHVKNGQKNKILIHVHGGLNFQTGTVERASKLRQVILDETKAYPIFINWQSSLFPSYGNHLTHIRQGEDWSKDIGSSVGAYATAPFYLAADLARSAIRVPTATFFQIRNDIETVPILRSLHSSDLLLGQQTMFAELCKRTSESDELQGALEEYRLILGNSDCRKAASPSFGDLSKLNISLGLDKRTLADKIEASVKYILTSPTKLATAPIIDAFGTSAWDVMLRSVSQLFHYDGLPEAETTASEARKDGLAEAKTTVDQARNDETDFGKTGALSVFFKDLMTEICGTQGDPCDNKLNWEITLVGHSTGAIIVNRIIREFGNLPIKNVVYMAAASSIRDYQDTIFPYLKRRNTPIPSDSRQNPCEKSVSHPGVCVYHLMLHEAAESGEWWSDIIDPFPRGSLLVWLDNFLSHPLSREDRTLGRFTNFIAAAHHTPLSLRPYITITKFGVGEKGLGPQKHGEFGGKQRFWIPECWGLTETVSIEALSAEGKNEVKCYNPSGHY